MTHAYGIEKILRPSSAEPSKSDMVSPGQMLPEKDVHEFIELWREAYGEELSYDEAKARAEQLVRFVLLMQRMSS